IPADIFARFKRLQGYDAAYICATDEHGTPIAVEAEKEHITPKAVADKYHALIRQDLQKMGCSFDIFSRTTEPAHDELTQDFFSRILENGYIYESEIEQFYCPKDKRFLPDRYVQGNCPHCKAENARGDQCESCGRYLKPTELIAPYCITCGTRPIIRATKHWFFKLSALQPFVEGWLKGNKRIASNVKNYAIQWINEGLRDWCITRDMKWGTPVPMEGAEDKVLYVWFDAPIGYITATRLWQESKGNPNGWHQYWQSEGSEIYHFIGKDIIYHHAIFWPAMLKARGEYNLPTAVVAGEYLTLEGKKMSKTRRWVVEISEYLKTFEPDPLRYYLTISSPLNKDADFSWDDFAKRHNDELADILGNFIHRNLSFVANYFDAKIPAPAEMNEDDKVALKKIREAADQVAIFLDEFSFHSALKTIIDLAAHGNKYFNDKEPWKFLKTAKESAATTLNVGTQIVKALAIMLEPFLPFTAEKIWSTLDMEGSIHEQRWQDIPKEISPGHAILKPQPLFVKIEDKTLQKQKEELKESLEAVGTKPQITMEDFMKNDLRIGKIVDAERVKGSDKLLKLLVDIGGKNIKQAISGIAQQYTVEELKGREIAVIVNLKPTKIFDVESQVMILAAEDGEKIVILQPNQPTMPGSKIR
ncbi:MAG TPA: methionine--tRNA ligase, partial [Candidatus Bathyarchaeia archaeon]|nr:methionine--tRNA ligase [Candidatus Bathyarchaeia archaeon]